MGTPWGCGAHHGASGRHAGQAGDAAIGSGAVGGELYRLAKRPSQLSLIRLFPAAAVILLAMTRNVQPRVMRRRDLEGSGALGAGTPAPIGNRWRL
jgi:hypothetical protein